MEFEANKVFPFVVKFSNSVAFSPLNHATNSAL
jgi:hypothetical protein